jgi:hypothetical protein
MRNAGLKIPQWSRGLLEKLMITQLAKIFSAFYVTRRFITMFTTPRVRTDRPDKRFMYLGNNPFIPLLKF